MPTFSYQAKTSSAETAQGLVEAETRLLAVEKLSARGFFPLKVEEFRSENGPSVRLKAGELAALTRQLADLLEARVPLLKALGLLGGRSRSPRARALVAGLLDDVQGGLSFSEALRKRPGVFPPIYGGLARAGELSGALSGTLAQLADFIEREEELRSRLRAAMVYPLFIACLGAATVLFLFLFIVPRLSVLFVDMSAHLPWITRFILGAGSVVKASVWGLPFLVLGAVLASRSLAASEAARLSLDARLLKLPVWGGLLSGTAVARFAKTLGILLKNGVALLDALRAASDVTGHLVLKRQVLSAARKVEEGASLADALAAEPGFPAFLCDMVRVGEEGNVLEEALGKAAASFERDTERSLKVISSLVEPVMILAVGSVVGLIVMGLLLPIFNMPALLK